MRRKSLSNNASNQHMPNNLLIEQISASPLCDRTTSHKDSIAIKVWLVSCAIPKGLSSSLLRQSLKGASTGDLVQGGRLWFGDG